MVVVVEEPLVVVLLVVEVVVVVVVLEGAPGNGWQHVLQHAMYHDCPGGGVQSDSH